MKVRVKGIVSIVSLNDHAVEWGDRFEAQFIMSLTGSLADESLRSPALHLVSIVKLRQLFWEYVLAMVDGGALPKSVLDGWSTTVIDDMIEIEPVFDTSGPSNTLLSVIAVKKKSHRKEELVLPNSIPLYQYPLY
jgi:hypothetical protein